jgi:hypothetical protein
MNINAPSPTSGITPDIINEVYENAINDPSLLSSLNIEELLDSLENDKNDYLEEKTLDSISSDIFNIINNEHIPTDEKQKICFKLINYRHVDELHELHKGKHVRWLRYGKSSLTNGGIVVDIKFLDTGTHILCKNSMNRFIQYKYDDCITFQKLSPTELLILMAYDYAQKNE